jgi:uncharacterized LabA/DUF88 family protein
MEPNSRVALLIDAENSPASSVEFVLSEVARHGVAHVRRAYGDWKNPSLGPWEERLHALAIKPIQQFSYTARKNASDIAMVIDAMDLMHAGDMDGIALMSSDADFTPLTMRLLSSGLKVYGYGERKTPAPFVNACSRFTFVDGMPVAHGSVTTATVGQVWSAQRLRSDRRLVTLLRLAVEASQTEDGWAQLGTVGQQIGNQASFDPRNYGYRKLSEVIEATGLFEVRRDGLVVSVRDRR